MCINCRNVSLRFKYRVYFLALRPQKTPILQTWPTQIFHFGWFFFPILPKSCKISCFFPLRKSKKCCWKVLKNKPEYFPNIFLQKMSYFSKFLCCEGHFCHQKLKKKINIKIKVPIDQPYLEGMLAHKTGDFFPGLKYTNSLLILDCKTLLWDKKKKKEGGTNRIPSSSGIKVPHFYISTWRGKKKCWPIICYLWSLRRDTFISRIYLFLFTVYILIVFTGLKIWTVNWRIYA